jgi:GT2 family glycosyltransferase
MKDLSQIRIDHGSIASINERITSCVTPYVLLCVGEVTLPDDALAELLDFLKRDERLALVQPKVMIADTGLIHPFGGLGGLTDRLGVGFTRGAVFGESEMDAGQFEMITDHPDWIYSPVMVLRRVIFEQVCGLDDTYVGQFAWMDFGARLRRMGYELYCYSSVSVDYPKELLTDVSSESITSLYQKISYVIRHNQGPWVLIVIMWLLIELLSISANLVPLRVDLVKSRLNALLKTFKSLPDLIRDRYLIQDGIDTIADKVNPMGEPAVFSIFWNHYARLGKTASNLLTVFLVIASMFSLTMRDRR